MILLGCSLSTIVAESTHLTLQLRSLSLCTSEIWRLRLHLHLRWLLRILLVSLLVIPEGLILWLKVIRLHWPVGIELSLSLWIRCSTNLRRHYLRIAHGNDHLTSLLVSKSILLLS